MNEKPHLLTFVQVNHNKSLIYIYIFVYLEETKNLTKTE